MKSINQTQKMVAACYVATVSVCALAATVTFPDAGGDLANGWDVKPTSSDIVKIDKAGTYTLSDDATFKALQVTAGGSLFSFGSHKLTTTELYGSAKDSQIVFNGGTFDLAGTATCQLAYNANNMNVVFTNGCIVTNVADFYASRYASHAKTEIAGNAKIYVDSLRLMGNGGSDNTLEIYDGGKLHVANRTYSDINAGSGHGGSWLVVRGAGSAFTAGGNYPVYMGYQRHSNLICVSDGATFYSMGNGGVGLGHGGGTATNNCLLVENSATAQLANVYCKNSGNRILVSNATFNCSSFLLADGVGASNNLFRAYGPATVLSLPGTDPFGTSASQNNVFSLEGGVAWDCGARNALMARTHHSIFRMTGAGTIIGETNRSFYFGDSTTSSSAISSFNSVSNRLEILDGAIFKALKVLVMGIGNMMCVSNATLDVDATDNVGLRVGYLMPNGYRGSTNCVFVLQGTTPKVRINGSYACVFNVGSTLRFEIPREGYAKGHVPLETSSALMFYDSESRLEIDCSEFVAKTGGKLHLIHAASIDADTLNRMRSSCSLPEGCELIISGGDLYIKSPIRKGFGISFR